MRKKGTVKKSKKRLFFSTLLTHFWPVFPFYIFRGVFRGSKMGTLFRDGLNVRYVPRRSM